MSTALPPVPDQPRRRHGTARAGRSRRNGGPRLGERPPERRESPQTGAKTGGLWVPQGRGLPAQDWAARHRLVTWILAAHLPIIVGYGYTQHWPLTNSLISIAPAAIFLVAAVVATGRRVRSLSASIGLFCCSAALVHLSRGLVEMHFHFFVVVGLVALYEDWLIHVFAIVFIGAEVGLLGAVWKDAAYTHNSAGWKPWLVVVVNAGFVTLLAVAQLIFWHYNEKSRRRVEHYREQLYEGQQSLMARLEETDRIRSDLVATVSHEFRTPLTTIRGAVLTVRRRRDRLSETVVDDMLDSAVTSVDRLSRLLENMLTAATATGTDDTTIADLPEVVEEVLATLQYSPSTSANVTVDLPPELPVRMARQALHQVVANLVDNALTHSWPGAPVRLIGGRIGDEVVLRVRNPGPDLDPATIRQLFEPFTQRDSSATRTTDGAGMGLYVVRRLVEVHGGRLRMASENGEIIVEVDLWAAPPRPQSAAPDRTMPAPFAEHQRYPRRMPIGGPSGFERPPGLTASSS